jgi:glucoamylase
MPKAINTAFGAPGSEPRWTHSAKEGIGTAYNSNSRVWFTLSHGILNEIYWPHVDTPNTRDFQLLITDGATFFHEEKRDLLHVTEYPERSCLLYRLTNSDPAGRYRLIKHVLSDPHRSVVLMHTRLEILDQALRTPGRLQVYALLAPHMAGRGAGNSGQLCEVDAYRLVRATGGGAHLVMGCDVNFRRRSVGFVGASDGWQDLAHDFQLDWEYDAAENGNIALTAEVDLSHGLTRGDSAEFTIAIGFGNSAQSAGTATLQSLATPFETHRAGFVRQWKRAAISDDDRSFDSHTTDGGSMYRLSRCVLLAHEDKAFEGALIASLSTPWGETKGDDDLGGYHLVWTRDMVHSATGLLATGQTSTPLRALIWLACIQEPHGGFPQNSWIDGRAYWTGVQLDEVAAPMLLAWRLRRANALQRFDPWPMLADAAAYLVAQGPVTGQERWEENSGYSPSTLATIIAGLVCTAEFAPRESATAADFLLTYADWLASHVEEWTVAERGDLVPGKPRHYVRITPADPLAPEPHPDVDALEVQIANGGGRHPARNVVSGDFLQLVRLGIRAPDDPIVVESLEVIDRVLRYDLPEGPCWRRYCHDGYGQKDDGSAFDGTGVGRCWPILTGERAHYELAAGRDPLPLIRSLELFANEGGMIPEQVWDGDDLPHARMKRGQPTGSAMPLCWAHAEYISLVRSRRDGVVFDRIEPAYLRYVSAPRPSTIEIWTLRHRTRRMARGKTLRVLLQHDGVVRWTADHWRTFSDSDANVSGLPSIWFVDLPTSALPAGAAVEFTIFWRASEQWHGENFGIRVVG